MDSFWSREPITIASTFRHVKMMLGYSIEFRMNPSLPALGPLPLEDVCGMWIAVVLLRRSRKRGNYSEFVQYETARKLRSSFSNFWQSSMEGLTISIMATDKQKLVGIAELGVILSNE